MTESQLREAIRKLAAIYSWRFQFHWSERYSPRGWPDITLCKPPRLIVAELKGDLGPRGGGPQPSPEQEAWLTDLRAVPGIEVYVWRPADLQRIAYVLVGQRRERIAARRPLLRLVQASGAKETGDLAAAGPVSNPERS